MTDSKLRVLDIDPQATLRDVVEIREEEGYKPVIHAEGKEALDDPTLGDADEVLIDIGTADIEAMKRALIMSDRILVPVPPSQADIWSTQRFVRLVDGLTKDNEKRPEIIGFINRGDTHHAVKETHEAAAALVALPGLRFIRRGLLLRTMFRRSFSEGLAVFEMKPSSKGASEFNALCGQLYQHLLS
jgi:chromosome partitioning protein